MITATGSWIVCKDERKPHTPDTDILLLDSTVKAMKKNTENIPTNILEVASVGPLVQDPNLKNLKKGDRIAVDFRSQVALMPLNRQESEFGIVIYENQVMFIVHEGDSDHITG
jgi:hypothetical protein